MTAVEAEDGNAIDRMAAHWVARRARGLSAAEAAELDAWRKADPRHSGSFLRALALEKLASSVRVDEPTLSEVVSIAADAGERPGVGRRQAMGLALAASLAAMIGVGGYRYFSAERMSTRRGEIRNVAMTDGSTAVLGTDSTITVAIGEERRAIELKSGQAWFEVAHDRARPFEVRHGDLVVRATGTAFEVGATPDGTDVIVTEGSVVVLRDGVAAPIAHLRAGERLTVLDGAGQDRVGQDRAVQKQTLDAVALQQRMAWREGMIVLDGRRLADAVSEVNRYNDVPIRIANPALADQRVVGTFRARDPDGLARALAIALDADVAISDSEITLR